MTTDNYRGYNMYVSTVLHLLLPLNTAWLARSTMARNDMETMAANLVSLERIYQKILHMQMSIHLMLHNIELFSLLEIMILVQ
jgi:hypothetical protein